MHAAPVVCCAVARIQSLSLACECLHPTHVPRIHGPLHLRIKIVTRAQVVLVGGHPAGSTQRAPSPLRSAVVTALGIVRQAEELRLHSAWRGCCLVVRPDATHIAVSSSLCERIHGCAGAPDHGSRVADVAQGAVHGTDIDALFFTRALHVLTVDLRRAHMVSGGVLLASTRCGGRTRCCVLAWL